MKTKGPSSVIDLYDDALLPDPCPAYQQLRDLGGAVWLSKYGYMHSPDSRSPKNRCGTDRHFPPRKAS
jgi:hypothetical protein